MASTCHLCGSDRAGTDDLFECADCGKLTCRDCESLGVGRETAHCQRCRG